MKLTRIALLLAFAGLAPGVFAQGVGPLFSGSYLELTDSNRLEGVFDLDGDGDLDAVGWFWSNCQTGPCQQIRLRAYENRGDGRLSIPLLPYPAWDIPSFDTNPTTWVGDLDGDGRVEVVIYREDSVYIFSIAIVNGITDIEQHPVISLQPETGSPDERSITSGDFNQDGLSDLAVTNSYRVTLILQQPGTFVFEVGAVTGLFGGPGKRVDMVSGELTGDGREDIAAIRQKEASSSWLPANLILIPVAGGQYFPKVIVPLDVGDRARLSLGDVDGDGDLDGVIFGSDGYQVWRRVSADQLMLEPLQSGGPATDLADIDGDGDLDGICCGGGGGGSIGNNFTSMFELCLNDGTGRFDQSVAYAGVGGHHVAGTLDIDGDGDQDILGGRSVLINHLQAGANFCQANPNSTGLTAGLGALGSTSLTRQDLLLRATGVPPSTLGLFLLGGSELTPPQPLSLGSLCLGGQVLRSSVAFTSAQGSAEQALFPTGNSFPSAVIEPGTALWLQYWFRDAPGTSNTSPGLRLVVAP